MSWFYLFSYVGAPVVSCNTITQAYISLNVCLNKTAQKHNGIEHIGLDLKLVCQVSISGLDFL